MTNPPIRVLLIEDDPVAARLIRAELSHVGGQPFELEWTSRLSEGLDVLTREKIDVILLDLGLPDGQGLATLTKALAAAPQAPIVVLTALDDEKLAVEAVRHGAQDYLVKGNASGEMLRRAMRHAIERKQAQEALRQREEQLRQSQKMEAVGRLAGGVAHDFSNLLTAILSYSEFLAESLPAGDPLRDDVEEIRHAAERGASLTRQLLALSRKQVLAPEVLDLNAVVTEFDRLLRRLIGEHINVVNVLSPALGFVKADRTQIEQVLVNMTANARDAMPNGGRITIETSNVDLSPKGAARTTGLEPGPYVALTVSDTGTGIKEGALEHLFEPFFTTREEGRGTGLGLATVYGIVRQSGGDVQVTSKPGEGSRFRVLLPRVGGPLPEPGVTEGTRQPPRGSETVLVVEDEESVRGLTAKALGKCGYTVLAASNPRDAIALARQRGEPLDLLLADVVLPIMSGPELARRIGADRPDMKVLFMSGFTDNVIVRQDVLDAGMPFLQKPFTPAALLAKVRRPPQKPRRGIRMRTAGCMHSSISIQGFRHPITA
jgi:signal transduction histidine kinase